MLVSDVMRSTLMTVQKSKSAYSLAQWYNNLTNISHVTYVVDEQHKLLGIVTIYDLISILASCSKERGKDLEVRPIDDESIAVNLELIKHVHVDEIMKKRCRWVSPDQNISSAVQKIMQHRYTAIPVLDENKVLVGEISRQIVLKALGPSVIDNVSGFTRACPLLQHENNAEMKCRHLV